MISYLASESQSQKSAKERGYSRFGREKQAEVTTVAADLRDIICGRNRTAMNLGIPRFTAARFSVGKLIREERTWRGTYGRSINGGKYVAAVEERQTPIKASSIWARQVAEGRIVGIGAGYRVEIVDAEADRVRGAARRTHVGCRKRGCVCGAEPGGVGTER